MLFCLFFFAGHVSPLNLLEVTNSSGLPKLAKDLLEKCKPSSSQLVNLLAHITMMECQFVPTGQQGSPLPPAGWDGLVASLNYSHSSYANFSCTLVLVTMGEKKQFLVSFPKQDVEISTTVIADDYIKEGTSDESITERDLKNVARLAQKLRNELLYPLQVAAHRILGLPSPFHLAGLPPELMVAVIKRLDINSALALSQCCKRLNEALNDDRLWEFYCRRDFGSRATVGDGDSWQATYKRLYQKQKQDKERFVGWQQPAPHPDYGLPQPRIYPTGPGFHSPPVFPYSPQPVGPYPSVPDPHPPLNPYNDPDSPYYGGDIPNRPPNQPGIGPFGGPPMMGDPLNPFGDPGLGGLGPGLPRRPRNNQPPFGPGGGGAGGFRFL